MNKRSQSLLKLFAIMSFVVVSGYWTKTVSQNYALKMNNANNAVLFDAVSLSPGTSWTAEMWVKRNSQSNFSTLIDGASSKFTLETWAASNAWTYKVGFSKKGTGDQTFNYILPLNTWTHLAYTCNGSSVSLYANGVLKGTISQVIDLPLKGFGLLGSPNETALATIDEVRYWKGVRTVAEITDNMNKSVDPSSPNLIAYWYFDDQATRITDLSTSGLFGTNTGCSYVANDNSTFVTNHQPMAVESVSCSHKNEYLLRAGDQNQEILCIEVNTTGVTNPVSLTSVVLNMNGTTATDNVSKVGVTSTGSSSTFASKTLFGAKVNPLNGNISFNGNIKLNPGKNYFWVIFDIAIGATAGSVFDASLVSATANNTMITPINGNPTSNRIITSELKSSSAAISIIPKPTNMTIGNGNLTLTNQFKIKYNNASIATQADSLTKTLNRATGFTLSATEGVDEASSIALSIISNTNLGDEGYTLEVLTDRIKIKANNVIGLFWGIQSLRQLLPASIESPSVVMSQAWIVPMVNITDVPRFKFRGIHLDVSRHFYSANFVKRYIDMLAMYKINYFHWHLTDDQGWRIEIKKYPKLQSISAWRSCGTGTYGNPDGSLYGGYYTQEEIKEVVAYAATRNVTIIPEIEMPGHSVSVLAAYPEMACTSAVGPFTVYCQGGITKNILCGGKEATHTFFKDVLTEVCELFPGKYIHLGGDEAPKDNWNTCTDCMLLINNLGLTGSTQTEKSNKLQKSMMEEMAQFLAPKGKIIMGWDEVTHGGIPTGATIQAWNIGVDVPTIAAAGHDVVMSNYTKIYLDSKQSTAANEPGVSWMGYNTLNVVYGYEPVPSGLSAAQQAHVIGLEGPIWTEELTTEDVIEYMLTPRALAIAERGWSPKEVTNFDNFKERLLPQYERFNLLNWNARKLETPTGTTKSVKSCQAVTLKAETDGSSYYWNDATHSTTREITVDKSGTYKCYSNFLGTIVENVYEVTIDTKTSTPVVKKNIGSTQLELEAEGDYDTYKWFTNNSSIYPVYTGKTLRLPVTTNNNEYYISAVQYNNNLSSLELDGSDDLLEFANSTFMNAAKAFTFESWVKVRTWRTWDVIFSKFTANTNRVALELGNSGELYCHMSNGASAYGLLSNAISPNTWTHIALVYDGTLTGNANRLKLYINGVLKTLNFSGTVNSATPTVSNPMRLGFPTQNPSMNYADLRFWSIARTADEIAGNLTKLTTYDSNLKLYYPLNNLSDSTLLDLTSGEKAILKNAGNSFASTDAVPNLMVSGCETQRWKVMDIEVDVTEVKNIKNTLGADIYPNPSSGNVTVDVKLNGREKVALKVYKLDGQTFISEMFESESFKKNISLKSLNKGVYFISVKAGERESITKVILK